MAAGSRGRAKLHVKTSCLFLRRLWYNSFGTGLYAGIPNVTDWFPNTFQVARPAIIPNSRSDF